MQCTNNLKQLGLAIHNFHDTNNGLPPGSSGRNENQGGWGWNAPSLFVLLYPFAEQNSLYDIVNRLGWGYEWHEGTWSQPYADGAASDSANSPLTDAEKNGFYSVSYMKCPSRRSGVGSIKSDATTPYRHYDNLSGGPTGDYAFVVSINYPVTEWWIWQTCTYQQGHWIGHKGPFRVATQTQLATAAESATTWRPRDTFSRMSDGTSNQIMIGEKQINKGSLGLCDHSGEYGGRYPNFSDCTYFVTGQWRSVATARHTEWIYPAISNLIGRPSDTIQTAYDSGNNWGANFGSHHPGVSNFVIGDGAVRGFPVTTSGDVLRAFGDCSDGKAVAIP
jgi:hypothetical protein